MSTITSRAWTTLFVQYLSTSMHIINKRIIFNCLRQPGTKNALRHFSTLHLSEFAINWIYFKRQDFQHCILGYPSDCFVNFSWESSLDTTLTVITCYNGVSISNTHYWCLVIVVVFLSNLGSFQQWKLSLTKSLVSGTRTWLG